MLDNGGGKDDERLEKQYHSTKAIHVASRCHMKFIIREPWLAHRNQWRTHFGTESIPNLLTLIVMDPNLVRPFT